MIDPLRYYSLESFLFEEVHARFQSDGFIGARDFFSIVIWKANRAKSKVARRLLAKANSSDRNLDRITRELTGSLSSCASPKDQLHYLIGHWGFRLPMASAILTVLFPKDFTVYDVRACGSLRHFNGQVFDGIDLLTDYDRLWDKYEKFVAAVRAVNPSRSLRDNDRFLWGASALAQLDCDIKKCFGINKDDS